MTNFCTIKLNKIDIKNREKYELKAEINNLKNDFNDLYNKYEELKIIKKNELKNTIKEVIFDKDIELKLF